jgi:hypothetical protein
MFTASQKSVGASARLQRLPMALALPILTHAETSACPAVGQLVNRIDDLFGKGSDFLPLLATRNREEKFWFYAAHVNDRRAGLRNWLISRLPLSLVAPLIAMWVCFLLCIEECIQRRTYAALLASSMGSIILWLVYALRYWSHPHQARREGPQVAQIRLVAEPSRIAARREDRRHSVMDCWVLECAQLHLPQSQSYQTQ